MSREHVAHRLDALRGPRAAASSLLPELITRDDRGYPATTTEVAVPRALAAHARQAVRDCPRMALRLDPA